MKSLLSIIGLLFLVAGCTREEATAPPAASPAVAWTVELLESPAAPGSAEPNLFAAKNGQVYLSWIRSDSAGAALQYAAWEGGAWSAARTVARGDDWFVNWADFPSMAVQEDGHITAHYLQKSAESTYAYDVRVTQSDDGQTWTEAITPHTDGTPTEHGFVSMLPWADKQTLLVWLDGRKTDGGGHGGGAMTLRTAFLAPDGTLEAATELDDRVCDCCQTDVARTTDGAIVVYRDRAENERRDISAVRLVDDSWTEPITVHADGWIIEGCPVNGPAMAARGERVVVAWFTAAEEAPRIYLAFSDDGGATFAQPLRIDEGQPTGRVDVAMLPDATTLLSWIEMSDAGADIRMNIYPPDDAEPQSLTIAQTVNSRAAGFPRLATTADAAYIAWTQPGNVSTIRTAKIIR